ncbi:MAG: site-specific integrase [Ignavibacteriae bacterium]|nr:site-specific integrase [Ignavibacteriota bacterium]
MKNTKQNSKHNNHNTFLLFPDNFSDSLDWWLEKYFENEVHTSPETQKAQNRDINLFLDYMNVQTGSIKRNNWTLKVSRGFQNYLKNQTDSDGKSLRNERTTDRIIAHLKTFAKWIHSIHPFTLFNPMLKVKLSDSGKFLDIDKAITSEEREKLLNVADNLIELTALSKDRHRYKDKEKPQLKYKRPYRDRAIIYTLTETGMRRSDVINITIDKVNFKTKKIFIKGKKTYKYQISRLGIIAIKDYIKKERTRDADKWKTNLLFLPSSTVNRGNGKLTPCVINSIWNKVCKEAGVSGKTPHSSRHAMGIYIMKKTGNPAAIQKQLGHKNPAYSVQYSKVLEHKLEEILLDR